MKSVQQFSMGASAAIMTSMGLIAGLSQGADARMHTISGLLIIAVADNISDSFGIHIYREAEGASNQEVRVSTLGNFFVRLILVLSFVLLVLLLPPMAAVLASSAWGIGLLIFLSYRIALRRGINPVQGTVWHVVVAILVIVGSRLLGNTILGIVSGMHA